MVSYNCINLTFDGGMSHLTRNWWMLVSREFELLSKSPVVSLSKKLHPHCLVLDASRNRFERDLHEKNMLVSQSNKNKLV